MLLAALLVTASAAACTGDEDAAGGSPSTGPQAGPSEAGPSEAGPSEAGPAETGSSRPGSGAGASAADGSPSASSTQPGRADLVRALRRLLDDRARAIRSDEQRAFERTLAGGDRDALVVEERLFHNFTTLPLARFGYRLDPRGVRQRGDTVTARVWRSVQLTGYDEVAVRTLDRVRFVRAPGSRRGWLVRSGTDERWRVRQGVPLQAWDVERIEVVERGGVLLVLDRASLALAPRLLDTVRRGIADVAPRVPYSWSESVVVFAPGARSFLRRVGDLPGGNPERLDAVTIPVRADGDTGALAASRIVLAPGALRRSAAVRDRLVRHELVHVALGSRDDAAPTWLAEGLAEWVSAAGLPMAERTIAGSAVRDAVDGVEGMPADETFNGAGAGANYGLAWFACEHLADVDGTSGPWRLLAAMRAEAGSGSGAGSGAGGTRLDEEAVDRVLRASLGLDADGLADAAARRIVATFG